MSHTFEYRDDGAVILTFAADHEDFFAQLAAKTWLKDRGFSIGTMQGNEPRGIMLGEFAISKWRGLAALERDILHGVMTGDQRRGPIRVEIYATAPADAREAIVAAPAASAPRPTASTFLDRVGQMAPVAAGFLCLAASLWIITHPAVLMPGPPAAKSTLRVLPNAGYAEARR